MKKILSPVFLLILEIGFPYPLRTAQLMAIKNKKIDRNTPY